MSKTEKNSHDLRFLPQAIGAWLIVAAALLIVAAVLYASGAAPLSRLGFASPAISFFAALGASLAATYGRKDGRLPIGLICALVLIALLLLTGFLIGGSLRAGAVLSVVGSTLSGSLLGVMLPSGKRRGGRPRPKRRRG